MSLQINLLNWLKSKFNTKEEITSYLNNKVDKVSGKSLVANTEITRLGGMETGANKITAGTGLTKSGTALGISNGGVTSTQIADGTINVNKLNNYMPKSNAGGGTAGYIKVLNIKTNLTYLDDPITFEIYQRQSNKPILCSLKFTGRNNADPNVEKFTTYGSNNEVYLYKASQYNWQVIVKKIDNYDSVTIENINCNWGRWSAWVTNISNVFTHLDETITTLPSNTTTNPLIKATYSISNVLTDTDTDRSLSANQGKVLKGLIDGKVGTGDARLTDERNPKMNYINASSSSIIDLDNYKTAGFYYNDLNTDSYYIKNCPWSMVGNAPYSKNKSFFLLVETWGQSNDNWVKQTLTYYYPNSITYIRVCNAGTWQPWKEVTLNGMEEIINSTQAEGSSAWTGESKRIVSLTSGTRINYWLKTTSGTDNVTLNLTLVNGDTTGAINVNPASISKTLIAWQMLELMYDGYNWNIVSPTRIINDLTTGGVGSALSAEQGKWLYNNKASSTHNHDTNYVKLSGGQTMTGNILIPSNADSSGNDATGYIPFAHTIQDTTKTVREILPTKKSFIGAVIGKKLDGSSGSQYDYVISARHRNGGGDGYKYGMYLRSGWSTNGDLIWSESNGKDYGTEKTILDSGNYSNYANKTTVDSALSSTSTNPVQNKVINTALGGKAPTSHTHTLSQITNPSHAVDSSQYGLGTTGVYGHCKTINGLSSTSYEEGEALSAKQGNVLKGHIDNNRQYYITLGNSSSTVYNDPFNFSIARGSSFYANVKDGYGNYATGKVYIEINNALVTRTLSNGQVSLQISSTFNTGTYIVKLYYVDTSNGRFLASASFKLTVT